MSSSDQPDHSTVQGFGFHQLRQACEISTLRQNITRILTNTADLQILIENEVEQVRQRLGVLSPEDLQDASKLSPLLGEALTALIEIREASRRLESSMARRDQTPLDYPPPDTAPTPTPPRRPVAPPPAPPIAAPVWEPPPPPPRAPAPAPAAKPDNRAKVTNWLMPASR